MKTKKPVQLKQSFFCRDTRVVAKELIGMEIIRNIENKKIKVRIVETEAYLPKDDPACHASRGMTPRNSVMYGPPGHIYVYFIYGNYEMLNFVTENEGIPGAVLIRAVEPMNEINLIKKNRNTEVLKNLTSGPAKLTMALKINRTLNNRPLSKEYLAVYQGEKIPKASEIIQTKRIGIREGTNLDLRFYEKNNPYVSVL